MRNHYNDMASMDRSSDLIKSMEREILELKSQLQVRFFFLNYDLNVDVAKYHFSVSYLMVVV